MYMFVGVVSCNNRIEKSIIKHVSIGGKYAHYYYYYYYYYYTLQYRWSEGKEIASYAERVTK